MENQLLTLSKVSKAFPGVKACNEVDFDVRPGEVHALVGENGAGKSTLMKIISGAYKKDSGTITFEGKEVDFQSPKDSENSGISIIYQELNLINRMTVAENVFLGRPPMTNGMVNWRKMNQDAADLFNNLNIKMDVTKLARELSIAQQQLVEIVKAVSVDAKIVIMDEPTSSLTDTETRVLFRIIEDLKSRNIAVVFISHRLDEVLEISDRLTVLRDGNYVTTRDSDSITKGELIALMIGRELTQRFPERHAVVGEELARFEQLSAGSKVKDVSFSIRRGEVLGFAGLVGAGRTETMRLIFGADKRHKGKMYFHGHEAQIGSPIQAIARKVGFLTENRKEEGLFLKLPVSSNIVAVAINKIKTLGILDYKKERSLSSDFVRDLRIVTPSIDNQAVYLSGGNQQKIVLAKWLLSDSELLILDEPTRGIDVGAKREIYEIINRLAESGKAIIVVSSDMEEIMGVSDRIIVMHEGVVSGEVNKEDFSQHLITEYAVGGV